MFLDNCFYWSTSHPLFYIFIHVLPAWQRISHSHFVCIIVTEDTALSLVFMHIVSRWLRNNDSRVLFVDIVQPGPRYRCSFYFHSDTIQRRHSQRAGLARAFWHLVDRRTIWRNRASSVRRTNARVRELGVWLIELPYRCHYLLLL